MYKFTFWSLLLLLAIAVFTVTAVKGFQSVVRDYEPGIPHGPDRYKSARVIGVKNNCLHDFYSFT